MGNGSGGGVVFSGILQVALPILPHRFPPAIEEDCIFNIGSNMNISRYDQFSHKFISSFKKAAISIDLGINGYSYYTNEFTLYYNMEQIYFFKSNIESVNSVPDKYVSYLMHHAREGKC